MGHPADPLPALRAWVLTGVLPVPRQHREADAIWASAHEQGLGPLLEAALRGSPHGVWPDHVRHGLRKAYRASFLRVLGQLELAERCRACLADHGIRALPMKGAALAERLYDSPAERPMVDVDLLVLDEFVRAAGLLQRAGLERVAEADHALALVEKGTGHQVELHGSVTSCPGFFPLDREGLWARSEERTGRVRRVPAPEDTLVQLSLHASFQHGLSLSLVQYLDFRRLLERTTLCLERVREAVARSRAERAVALALKAAQAVVGLELPPSLAERLEAWLGPVLRKWLQERTADPCSLLSPAPPSLLRLRWEMAAGRRAEFVRRTLAGGVGGSQSRSLPRLVRRGARLFRRWLPHLVQGRRASLH